jgi:hypothetical protein
MIMLAFLIQSSSFLRMFVDSCDEGGCEDTALNWLIAALVVSVIFACAMLTVKWFKKKAARNIIQKTWSGSRTAILIALGLLPVVLTLIIVWYATRNFYNYVSISGLVKGIVFSWLLYITFMLAGHLLSPQWRRDLF